VPELPEVETMVRGIRPLVEGRAITAVRRCRCACKPISIEPRLPTISRRVRGTTVTQVRRLAKRIIMDLSSGDHFVIEPRMTGLMLLGDPPDREHLRLEWRFSRNRQHNSLWFWDRRGLGTVRLLRQVQLADQLGPQKLGPDALNISQAQLRQLCAGTSRAIKVALLDQRFAAGIGNVYASEILHLARIHPEQPANELNTRQLYRLSGATRKILCDAIQSEGSTLNDGTYRNALNQNGSYQNAHKVYNREAETCLTCRKKRVRRIVQVQRSTFFCPICQRPT